MQPVKKLEAGFADNIFLYIDLDASSRTLQMRKTRLPHQSVGNDAPGDTHLALVRFQFRPGRLTELASQGRRSVRPTEFPGIGIEPQRLNLLKFLLPLLKLVLRFKLQARIPFGVSAREYSGPRRPRATNRPDTQKRPPASAYIQRACAVL